MIDKWILVLGGHADGALPTGTYKRLWPSTRKPGAFSFTRNRLELGHESATFIRQEGRHDAEDGVTEAADVQHGAWVAAHSWAWAANQVRGWGRIVLPINHYISPP